MSVQKKKRQIIGSSAALLSIAVHILLLFLAGGIVALRYFAKDSETFTVTEQKKLERRQLDIPVQVQPFMEQMSKPSSKTTSRITASTPQMVNIPEQGMLGEMAPMPTFKGSYTNFVQTDRTLIMNAKYREVGFGISKVDFFGTRGRAEKVLLIMDATPTMVSEDRGGLFAYEALVEEVRILINELRSSTLFNLILHDQHQMIPFQTTLVPATATHKTNLIEWVASINTQTHQLGLANDTRPAPRAGGEYEIPMQANDITGWLKAIQFGTTLQPEVIFFYQEIGAL